MRPIRILLLAAIALASPVRAETGDNPRCEPLPLFSRFPGERLGSCERSRFSSLELWRWKTPGDPKSGSQAFRVEGEYWYYFNELQKDARGQFPGKVEVQRNYANAVKAAKGRVLHADTKSVTYVITRPDGEFWGEAGCGRGGDDCSAILHKIVRVEAMKQSVVVTADQIARSIADEGKAVFYGLYFDTGKSTLKPEATPTLVEMARWLAANPATNVFIVGHTDMVGTVPSNLELSRARAAAVVEALVRKHGVKADRIASEGVGPYAPLSNNTAEAGRALNRRVEMVLR